MSTRLVIGWLAATLLCAGAVTRADSSTSAAAVECGDIADEAPLGGGEFQPVQRARRLVRRIAQLAVRSPNASDYEDPTGSPPQPPAPPKLLPLLHERSMAIHQNIDGTAFTLLRAVPGGHCVVNTWRFTLELPSSADVTVRGIWQSPERVFLLLHAEGDANEHGNDGGPILSWIVLGSDGRRLWVAREHDEVGAFRVKRVTWRLVPTGDTVVLALDKRGKKRVSLDAAGEKFR